jgi:hypothetical protein
MPDTIPKTTIAVAAESSSRDDAPAPTRTSPGRLALAEQFAAKTTAEITP